MGWNHWLLNLFQYILLLTERRITLREEKLIWHSKVFIIFVLCWVAVENFYSWSHYYSSCKRILFISAFKDYIVILVVEWMPNPEYLLLPLLDHIYLQYTHVRMTCIRHFFQSATTGIRWIWKWMFTPFRQKLLNDQNHYQIMKIFIENYTIGGYLFRPESWI